MNLNFYKYMLKSAVALQTHKKFIHNLNAYLYLILKIISVKDKNIKYERLIYLRA